LHLINHNLRVRGNHCKVVLAVVVKLLFLHNLINSFLVLVGEFEVLTTGVVQIFLYNKLVIIVVLLMPLVKVCTFVLTKSCLQFELAVASFRVNFAAIKMALTILSAFEDIALVKDQVLGKR